MIGHDIGGMIAYAFTSRFPKRTASLIWGECPLPGTTAHQEDRTTNGVQQFHFLFHSIPDLPEALVSGREEIYLTHFFSKLAFNCAAITQTDIDYYVKVYSRPGALRCGFNVYRTFLQDASENHGWVAQRGKCNVRTLGLNGAQSRHKNAASAMMEEVHAEGSYDVAEVPDSGHWIAEENPEGFVKIILDFTGKEKREENGDDGGEKNVEERKEDESKVGRQNEIDKHQNVNESEEANGPDKGVSTEES